MKAVEYRQYGSADVLEVNEVARPEINDDQVLVKVYATTVTTADWRLRASAFPGIFWLPGRMMFGLRAPKNRVLGSEFAGRIVSVGAKVTRFKLGDAVFGIAANGAHAEYLAIGEDAAIVKKPDALGYDEAAAIPFGGLAALVFLRDFAKLRPGQTVLVNGASGGVGVFAVQIAKHLGAAVTAVTSTANVEVVRSLGADRVIDYSREDLAGDADAYDVILDPVGKSTFSGVRRALKPKGVYVPLEFSLREIVQALLTGIVGGRRVVIGVNGDSQEDLALLSGLVESGALRPVIDSRFPLARIAEAHRRVESRHKTGSVVVTVDAPASYRAAA